MKLFWTARVARQREIDASIAAKADYEYLYDKPYDDKKKVRVAGPFTVESLSPHRLLGVDEDDELIDQADDRARNVAEARLGYGDSAGLRHRDGPGQSQDLRRPTGAQRGPHFLLGSQTLARRPRLRRGNLRRRHRRFRLRRDVPASSSAPNSAPSPVPIWCKPPAKPQTRTSTC